MRPTDFTIVVGTSRWNSFGTNYKVREFVIHEQYYGRDHAFDIALVRVQDPIKFTKYVKPIRYSAEEVPDDVELEVFGWGRLSVGCLEF